MKGVETKGAEVVNPRFYHYLFLYLIVMAIFFSCVGQTESNEFSDSAYAALRAKMVETQLIPRDISDDRVLAAMGKVKRHLFIPKEFRAEAYTDGPLPIGQDQTISQPYIVALMTELLKIDSSCRILEIGTGSGYQAAILGEIGKMVYSIEIIPSLADRAERLLDSLGYKNVEVRTGDGYLGWPEKAPFDAVIVTAAAPKIPQPLIDQLNVGGRMVIPVGDFSQELYLIEKTKDGVIKKAVIPVRFVPMTGEVQKK
ncbi:Protein-L-isoaspartate O-methyltransferase [Candidatus Zixiibacteriota bacterium]|nr:Protein-L-isoaspartate O-methyltransferase [candidate division Zixibacteria bacterium]